VVDASALAKYLLREEGWRSVERYLERGVYSVSYVVKEVANAVWKHSVVHGRIDASLALELYRVLKMLIGDVVVLEPQENYLDEAVRIAFENSVTVYDALYIAQALSKGELLTADTRQARVARMLGVVVHEVCRVNQATWTPSNITTRGESWKPLEREHIGGAHASRQATRKRDEDTSKGCLEVAECIGLKSTISGVRAC